MSKPINLAIAGLGLAAVMGMMAGQLYPNIGLQGHDSPSQLAFAPTATTSASNVSSTATFGWSYASPACDPTEPTQCDFRGLGEHIVRKNGAHLFTTTSHVSSGQIIYTNATMTTSRA